MICGKCKSEHETVAQVRACYQVTPASTPNTPPTSPQPSPVERFNALAELLPQVERARYAVATPERPDRTWQAYQVDRPTEGKWAGRTFVKVCSSDEAWRLPFSTQLDVLQKIVDAGPEEALAEYGHRVGRCGVCNRTLTDPDSIALGIGPICRARW